MNEEQLKGQYLSWLESVKIRRLAYDSAKFYFRKAQENLKISKRVFNRTYKDWKQARIEVERSKRKWKVYPYNLRLWSKNNFGKVMILIEEQSIKNEECKKYVPEEKR